MKAMIPVRFTRFTSTYPLSKIISRGPDGGIIKMASANMAQGRFETLTLDASQPGAAGRLGTMLQDFTQHQALSPSLCLSADSGHVVTRDKLCDNPGSVARTAQCFGYRAGTAGLLVLDYDPQQDHPPLAPADLWAALLGIWPEAASGIAVHMHSASGLIFDREIQLSGISGQRLYIAIQDNADLPRALAVLNKRAWLKGIGGHILVSKIGSTLVRSLFDSTMGDAGGHLDFAPAGAICRDGLEQRRGLPTAFADGVVLDTAATLPDLAAREEGEYSALIEAAKTRAAPLALQKKQTYLAEKCGAAALQAFTEGRDPDEARERVRRNHEALLGGVLAGTAEVIHVDDAGEEIVVTVDQLLSDPARWHLKTFLSPLDPYHRGRSPDAIAYLLQPQPNIFDLNDGGITYRLQRQPLALQVTPGNRAPLADHIATELAKYPDLLNCAGRLVRVTDGAFAQVAIPVMRFLIGMRVSLSRPLKEKTVAVDVDGDTAAMVLVLLTERARKVIARSSIPLIDTDGRVISAAGLDEQSGVYIELNSADVQPFPMTPTRAETVTALRRLWHPWSLYEWTTPHSRAAMLATVLTVPMRPLIDAAPGLFVDAPSRGAGKSSAAAAVLALVQGHRGNVKSWTRDSEVEIEKYLLSLAACGASAVSWDNITGTFDSSLIATSVVEGRVSARKMGVTEALSPAFRAMWLASGNNAALGADCGGRFLQARIACPDGEPHRKSFPFEPSAAALADREGIVRSILTVHRAWHAAGRPMTDGTTTRFAQWGPTVRQLALWLGASGIAKEAGVGELADPAYSILEQDKGSDPRAENATALLVALHENYGGEAFTARDVLVDAQAGRDSLRSAKGAVWEALRCFFPRSSLAPSLQALSATLRYERDRMYAGLKLEMLPRTPGRKGERSGQLFQVIEVA